MIVKTIFFDGVKSRNRPSFFAGPVAWAVADFARSLIEDQGPIDPHRTGLIVVSDECTLGTIRELACTAAQGNISPLRFAGASPSILAGLPAIEHGIRGPAVCLTMPPQHSAAAISSLVHYWIYASDVVAVVTIAHFPQSKGGHVFQGFVAKPDSSDLSRDVLRLVNLRQMEQTCRQETFSRY